MQDDFMINQSYPMLAAGEAILWRGKPKRRAFIATKSLTLLPIAVFWLILDLNFFGSVLHSGSMRGFLILFMLVHMMPVWLWLGNMLTAGRRWKNTNYYVTNRRIILQSGFFAVNETSLFYKELRNANMRVDFLNKLFHTGNIVFDSGMPLHNRQSKPHMMENLENSQDVYNRIQRLILDIQTDMEYPNAFRPEENPGYQTKYHQ